MSTSPPFEIIYEDNHLLVVLKPAGAPSQPDKSGAPDMLGLLKRYLIERDHKKGGAWLGLVHRLDRPTSGLMVFAKTSKAASRLSEEFRGQNVRKFYLARLRGTICPDSGTLRDILTAGEIDGRIRIVRTEPSSEPPASGCQAGAVLQPHARPSGAASDHAGLTSQGGTEGKFAELSWTTIAFHTEKSGGVSLVFIELHTGRRHQIRVQFAGRGCPVLGDRRYGFADAFDLSVPTIALHACGLVFRHPTKKMEMAFYADPSSNPSFSEEDTDMFLRFLGASTEKGSLPQPFPG